MDFPYTLLSFEKHGESFVLFADSIDEGTAATKQYGIVSAVFRASLDVDGIKANIICDFTLKNLFDFYNQLADCYNKVIGHAVLEDYVKEKTMLRIGFLPRTGHVCIEGKFTKYGSQNMVGFSFTTDQAYIKPMVSSLRCFFDELAQIQGFYDFQF